MQVSGSGPRVRQSLQLLSKGLPSIRLQLLRLSLIEPDSECESDFGPSLRLKQRQKRSQMTLNH